VKIAATAETFTDTVRGVEAVHRQLSDAIAHILGIRVKLTLVEPNTIARSQGKAKRVIDNRNSDV